MDEMRMAKFETFIEDINNAIKKRSGGGILGFSSSMLRATRMMTASITGKTISPLGMIFDIEELNESAVVILNKATIELAGSNDRYEDPWFSRYGSNPMNDAKTKIEAAKDFVKYCRDEQNRPEAYKFIFWSLMILSVEKESSDKWLSLICDFARMLRITDDELMDITYAIKCVYNEVENEYVFKTETIPGVLGNLFNLYGNSDFAVE